jgi:TRAP-type mannitol/chloroaromatic compound transport system permease small subunit
MKKLDSLFKVVDSISEWSGKGVSFLIFAGIGILALEVLLRYVFHRPTMWAHGSSQRLFAVYYVLAGAYVLRYNGHVTVDVIFNRFSKRTKAILHAVNSLFLFVFCGILLWKGLDFAWTSLSQLEPDETPWRAPLYPAKMMVPVGAALILIQGLANAIRDLRSGLSGGEEP